MTLLQTHRFTSGWSWMTATKLKRIDYTFLPSVSDWFSDHEIDARPYTVYSIVSARASRPRTDHVRDSGWTQSHLYGVLLWYHGPQYKEYIVYKLVYDVLNTLGYEQSSDTPSILVSTAWLHVRRPTTRARRPAETDRSRTRRAPTHIFWGARSSRRHTFLNEQQPAYLLDSLLFSTI